MYNILIKTKTNQICLTVPVPSQLIKAALEDAVRKRMPLCDLILRYLDLSNINLQGADLRGVDFTGTVLQEANLQNAKLNDAILIDADLTKAHLDKADLVGADLRHANFEGTCVAGTGFDDLRGMELLNSRGAYNLSHLQTSHQADVESLDLVEAASKDVALLEKSFPESFSITPVLAKTPVPVNKKKKKARVIK